MALGMDSAGHAPTLAAEPVAPSALRRRKGPVAPWFLAWWEQQGGKLHQHELSFMGELKRLVPKEKNEGWLDNYGAFLRLDLHLLVNRSSVPPYMEDEMVLYTDADVIFLKVSASGLAVHGACSGLPAAVRLSAAPASSGA
jgi:hypothetical protein